jgi:hypothetical protein
MNFSEDDEDIDGGISSKQSLHHTGGLVVQPVGQKNRHSRTSIPSSNYSGPVQSPTEKLVRIPPYPNGGAIGSPVQPTSAQHHQFYPPSSTSRRAMGGAIANASYPVPSNDMSQQQQHPDGTFYVPFDTNYGHGNDDLDSEQVDAEEMSNMMIDNDHQHAVLKHLVNNSVHDILQPTTSNIITSRRFYDYPDHSFFNAAMIMTVIGMLMAFATAFVSEIVSVCQIAIDLYWYRLVYIILGFVIALAFIAIIMLHVYRHRSFSKDHVLAITLPAVVFVAGDVMCGFGLQWYVSTHGTTIHWHSAAQMSSLSNILLMNWAWGMIMLPLGARALACHYIPEQAEPQVTVELGFSKDDVDSSAIMRGGIKTARMGMSSTSSSLNSNNNPGLRRGALSNV